MLHENTKKNWYFTIKRILREYKPKFNTNFIFNTKYKNK